jgi:hypothetical protein
MANSVSPKTIKKMVSYYYLVFFCPPEYIRTLEKSSRVMRTRLAEDAGTTLDEFTNLVVPEVALRVVAFQHATRLPEDKAIQELAKVMRNADGSREMASAYQEVMKDITSNLGRAKPANRLHRQKGCDFCDAPCQYGFFTLMSEPNYKTLQVMLDAENKKNAKEHNVVNTLWGYTRSQIWNVLETRAGMITAEHLGNLSYCLLLQGIAKSRFALPEKQLKTFQALNRGAINRLHSPAINLAMPG